jgi:hypothetical protein
MGSERRGGRIRENEKRSIRGAEGWKRWAPKNEKIRKKILRRPSRLTERKEKDREVQERKRKKKERKERKKERTTQALRTQET